jgi:hypothetical protein
MGKSVSSAAAREADKVDPVIAVAAIKQSNSALLGEFISLVSESCKKCGAFRTNLSI